MVAKEYKGKPLYKSWKDFDHPRWQTMTRWKARGRKIRPDAEPRAYVWQAANTTYIPLYSILETQPMRRRKNPNALPLPGTPECAAKCATAPQSQQWMMPSHQRCFLADDGRVNVVMHYWMTSGWRYDLQLIHWRIYDRMGGRHQESDRSHEVNLKDGKTLRQVYEDAYRAWRKYVREIKEQVTESAD